ncbi:sugar transferase [Vibrio sp. HN007]|uniref:sugar transferase n=1 Tax=Vibrio iocasae TaxID=3098914 RepID=UPI0035D3EEDA
MNTFNNTQTVFVCKRAFDVLVSLVLLAIFTPLLPVIALMIKSTSEGPVIYGQMRIGKYCHNKAVLFEMFKFRTMYCDAEARSGAVWAKSNDPRITPFGLVLRKSRLDEIPQLLNVLKGEMSLIGPRPERPVFYKKLDDAIPFFAERTYGVLPGITGLAQVNQGYDSCIEDVKRKVAYDHSYALCMGSIFLWLKTDIQILLRTVLVMVQGRGQ